MSADDDGDAVENWIGPAEIVGRPTSDKGVTPMDRGLLTGSRLPSLDGATPVVSLQTARPHFATLVSVVGSCTSDSFDCLL